MSQVTDTSESVDLVQIESSVPYVPCINEIFNSARKRNEFEYICALLRMRGMEDAGWDPLDETSALVRDIYGLLQAPLVPHTRVRLMLLLYGHLTEVDAIYMILKNMLRVSEGDHSHMSPFEHLYEHHKKYGRKSPSAVKVVTDLTDHATKINSTCLTEAINSFFDDGIRNAFFHSDYTLHNDEFRTPEGKFYEDKEGVNFSTGETVQYKMITKSLKLQALVEKVQKCVSFF